MNIASGYFSNPEDHHDGWFRVFRFKSGVEIWFGHHWYMIGK